MKNSNLSYKPKNAGKKYNSKNNKTKHNLWRAFKKKIRQMLKKSLYEDLEE